MLNETILFQWFVISIVPQFLCYLLIMFAFLYAVVNH